VYIRNFVHKGLMEFYSYGSLRGVPPDSADKLRKMLSFLDNMDGAEELSSLPAWKVIRSAGTARELGV